ncbi:MAG: B12-binding domain-containing radical SAM protein [Anaerolineales bacterium]|nr:B12-binding domain-containing radical SAM protein [Anaerolineales bacterium]
MAKVLFINPIVRQEDVPRHVPYGIALLASLAMKEGHLVQVYDANAWRLGDEVLRQAIEADDWDVIATGGISTTYSYVKKICPLAKAYAPDALLVVGGGLMTAMPRDIMQLLPQIDIGVIGEAFQTFNDILAQVGAKRIEPGKISGLIFRGPGDKLVMTGPRELLQDLDTLPYPAYDLFPLEEIYFPNSQVLFSEEGMVAKRRLDINASYGCSLVCKFCFHLGISGDLKYIKDSQGEPNVLFDAPGTYTRTIRYHSPRYIVDMVKYLRQRYQIDFVGFLDENLMTMDVYSGRTWLKEICEFWLEEGLQPQCIHDRVEHSESCHGVHWSGTSHATLCTPTALKMMRQAGCSHLVYGYESFSPQILKRLGKGSTPKTNIQSYFWTMEAGIRPIPNQIMGFPSEDFDSLRDCMRAWEQLGIVVKPFFATPYPGSFWYQVYKDRILEQYGGDLEKFMLAIGDATDVTAVISENFDTVELYGLRELMIRFDYNRLAEYEREWKRRNPEANAIKQAEEREKHQQININLSLGK